MEITNRLAIQIENELKNYFSAPVQISPDNNFSASKLIRRISLFENHIYPNGKFDSQMNYKFWYDEQKKCIDSNVKNIDIDTKNFKIKSDRKIDELPLIISNLKIKDYLRKSGQAEEINASVEEFVGWGNLVFKKIKKGYERGDLKNFYVINQTAETLDESPVIERHQLGESDLRAKKGVWEHISDVITSCKADYYAPTAETQGKETTTPYYDIYERNGEVCLADLRAYQGKKASEKDKEQYVLARVIGAGKKEVGVSNNVKIEYILFAEEIKKMPYEEAHYGIYKGRWFREGIYEITFDDQVRLNQIGNQLARGLEYASTLVLTDEDKLVIQSITTDIKSGDFIRSKGLHQVDLRMHAADQLIADWNRTIQSMRDKANSTEVVMGEALPSGTPLGAYNALNMNANKLFGFLQEKLAIPFGKIFENWLIPELVKDITSEEVLNLTGDADMLDRVRLIIVDDWYLNNLIFLPPHDQMMADTLKAQKLEELKSRPQLLLTGLKELFKDFAKNCYVDITGESSTELEDTQSLVSIIQMEADPVRRSYMVDILLKSRGFDVGKFPKAMPQVAPLAPQPTPTQPQLKTV